MNHICIVTGKYPNELDKTAMAFVQQFAWSLADLGKKVTVISPIPVNIEFEQGLKLPCHTVETTDKQNYVNVYLPKYLGFGQKTFGPIKTATFTFKTFYRAVLNTITNLPVLPEVLYGHFISPSGLAVNKLGKHFGVPSFVTYGESTPWPFYNLGKKIVVEGLYGINGIVAVSEKNKKDLIQFGITEEEKIIVIPNAVRASKFYPRDKHVARKKFGFENNAFIIAFVGHFNDRKGSVRVAEALDKLDDEVYGIYAGKGRLTPISKKRRVLFADLVSHDDLPFFYSAADIFVLPTLNEGCCNAIIEAMACGLPIISSNLSFNDGLLDETNSIRINPHDTSEIACAIGELYKKETKREKLGQGSLIKAKALTSEERTKKIISFMIENSEGCTDGNR